jgi:hypothetical protein
MPVATEALGGQQDSDAIPRRSPRLMYSRIYLRLDPLGLELVAAAARAAGHEVRPDAVGFSLNYLANVPEVLDLARATRQPGAGPTRPGDRRHHRALRRGDPHGGSRLAIWDATW